ncbi:MAG: dual specificity protein phosphatase family protein [Thaumarchaeota archaeon]|nr:dual specificity protein phosphatase family protein [Nitrososphaerota archaeon]
MSFLGKVYRRVLAVFMDRPTRFSWVDESVAASGRPMTLDQLRWIRSKGVELVISLTEVPLPREWIEETGLKYRHMPIEDHSAPDPETLKNIVDIMLKGIEEGKKILVHCAAGLGRTGTVLAAYLIARRNLSAEEAIEEIRRLRPGSIEPNQESSVRNFYRRYFS